MSNRRSYSASQYTGSSKKRGMSPGRSMAQFGHAGHAGKSQSQAKKHQKAGINTPSSGPGSNPNMGQTPSKKTATIPTPKKTTIKKGITATKAAGKTAKELAYLKSLGRLFAGDISPAIKMIGGQYVYDKTAPTLKGLGSKISNFFFSPAGAAEMSPSNFFPEGDFQNIKATAKSPTDYNIQATKDLVENLPGGAVRDILAPAAAGAMSIPYDAIQAATRTTGADVARAMDTATMSGPRDIIAEAEGLAYAREKPLSSLKERTIGAAGPLAERFGLEQGGLINLFKNGGFLC